MELSSTGAQSIGIIDLTVSSIINPTNGTVITKVSEGTRQDVDKAVAAAQKAYDTVWGLKVSGSSRHPGCRTPLRKCLTYVRNQTPGFERGKLLIKLAELIEENADELAAIESLDNGKVCT